MGRVEDAMRRAAGRDAGNRPEEPDSEAQFEPEERRDAEPAVDDVRDDTSADRPVPDEVLEVPSEPAERPMPTSKMVGDNSMLVVSREQYRRLAATLHNIQATTGVKVVLIASAVAGEGKTLTAANLALTFSESYERKVLLVDADLRRPSLARTFGVDSQPGLSECLVASARGPIPFRTLTPKLTLLPAGAPTTDPMAGLTSSRMLRIVEDARQKYDWVLVDTPPVGLMTDANLLSAMADGTVFVIKANSTPYDVAQRAIDLLGRDTIIGAVLNRTTAPSRADNYYNYYRYAGTGQARSAESA